MNATAPRRMTRQQSAILAHLDTLDDFVTAQQLHAQLRESGETIGLATVYRTLQSMATQDAIDVIRTEDGESAYRRCSTGHHHHLVCRQCGRAVEVEGPAVENWASAMGTKHGFVQVEHTVEIFGTCRECAARQVDPVTPSR